MSKLSYFFRETLISLRRNLMMTIAGVLTIAVSMSLLGGSLLLRQVVNNGVDGIRKELDLDVYLNVGVTPSQLAEVASSVESAKSDGLISDYNYLDDEATYAEAKKLFRDNPEYLSGIEVGDLPTSYRTQLVDASVANQVADLFEGRPGVRSVKYPEQQAKTITRVANYIQLAFLAMVIVLGAAALFLVVNTIRLATYARRREIEVMKLVGASNWFVRVPFMAEGLVQGALGAGVAVGVVYGLKSVLANSLGRIQSGVIQTFDVTSSDARWAALVVLLFGAVIGLAGSLLGLRRFLDV
jgi:cell division transport system permease protein